MSGIDATGMDSYTVSQSETVRRTQLDDAERRLTEQADRLLKVATVLQERLEPVLRPSQPTPARNGEENAKMHDPNSAPLATRLHEIAERMRYAGERLDDVHDRLEV